MVERAFSFHEELSQMEELIRDNRPDLRDNFLRIRTPEALVAFLDQHFPRATSWGYVPIHRSGEELRRVMEEAEND